MNTSDIVGMLIVLTMILVPLYATLNNKIKVIETRVEVIKDEMDIIKNDKF